MVRRILFPLLLGLLLLVGGSGWLITPTVLGAADDEPGRSLQGDGIFIYVPVNATRQAPLQVLVALHGMGDNGANFAQSMLDTADRNGWVVLAPTFRYQDYRVPELVAQDDTTFLPKLAGMLDNLPQMIGLPTRDKALLFGFSRGGQAAHRFATFFPERTAAVAAICAGSYTLPLNTMLVNGRSQTLPLPYGVIDMPNRLGRPFDLVPFKQIPFRISVGANDVNPNETPRAWDPYLGQSRVDRAQTYTRTLQALGLDAQLVLYSGVGHQVTKQMLDENLIFLNSIRNRNAQRYGFAPFISTIAFDASLQAAVPRRR